MPGYNEKTIWIVQFLGKRLDWRMWSKKFLAMSGKKQYKDVLTRRTVVPAATAVIDISNDAGKDELKAREANEEAYHDLILANPNKVAFNLIDKSLTTELPDSSAPLVWKKLSAKYDSHSLTTVVELSNQFNNSKLTSLSIDPEDWIV